MLLERIVRIALGTRWKRAAVTECVQEVARSCGKISSTFRCCKVIHGADTFLRMHFLGVLELTSRILEVRIHDFMLTTLTNIPLSIPSKDQNCVIHVVCKGRFHDIPGTTRVYSVAATPTSPVLWFHSRFSGDVARRTAVPAGSRATHYDLRSLISVLWKHAQSKSCASR